MVLTCFLFNSSSEFLTLISSKLVFDPRSCVADPIFCRTIGEMPLSGVLWRLSGCAPLVGQLGSGVQLELVLEPVTSKQHNTITVTVFLFCNEPPHVRPMDLPTPSSGPT